MEKGNLIPWGKVIDSLKAAALYPQRRGEMIARTLQELLVCLPAVGTALVWPCQDRNTPWKVYYAGDRRESIQRWLAARVDVSLDVTHAVIQRDLSKRIDLPTPHIIRLQPPPIFPAGLWIIWSHSHVVNASLEAVRQTLEALIEVQGSEEEYFFSTSLLSDKALIEALAQGDPRALSAFLGFAGLVGKGEMTAWGQVYLDVVETKDEIGAKQNGFGFVVPSGHGIGGRIVTSGVPILPVEDYRHSPYRDDPEVSAMVDSERLRSVMALPIRTRQGEERSGNIGSVLYVARRSVKPFSLAEQLRVQRLTHLLEPIRPPACSPSFLFSDQRTAWYKLLLRANHIADLEASLERTIHGTVIITDSDGHPYVSARSKQLKDLQANLDSSKGLVQVISLDALGVSSPSKIYFRSAQALPPSGWSDFFTDLAVGCNLIIRLMEQEGNALARLREHWLQAVLQGELDSQISQDGYQLSLPIENGQIWVVAWPSQRILTRQSVRERMLVENIVLGQLKRPLLFFGDDVGVILLDEHAEQQPSRLYDALLTQFAPHPFWIAYGMRYHSLHDLKMVLPYSISQAQKARREKNSEGLLDVRTLRLSSLLANPGLAEELCSLTNKLLTQK